MAKMQELSRLLANLRELAPRGFSVGLHIRVSTAHIFETTYDPKWVEHYVSNSYTLRDPMFTWGLHNEGTIRWSEIDAPDPYNIMGQAKDYGLTYGICVACGPMQSRSIVGMARGDREFTDAEIEEAKALAQKIHDVAEPEYDLTPAQLQALRCIASGDRHTAAAARLGISESALKARLVSARARLSARTTSEAIQKAKEINLI